MTAGERPPDRDDYEAACSGTVYWTLSLYIDPEKVAAALSCAPGERLPPAICRVVQAGHLPSRALRVSGLSRTAENRVCCPLNSTSGRLPARLPQLRRQTRR
jgi:hypothetical protein